MPDQHAQHPSQQHNMQGNPQPVHRTTPTGMEKMRHTPDLASSRLSHQPGHSMAKSMSPSSVSYSVTHQPHPGLAAGMSNAEPSPYFGSLQHNQMSGQVMGGVGSHGMQRPRMQMPGAASDMSPHFNSALPRHGTPGLNSGMGGQGLPGPAMSRSHSQQLKALADKKQDRFPAGKQPGCLVVTVNIEWWPVKVCCCLCRSWYPVEFKRLSIDEHGFEHVLRQSKY